MDAGTWLSPGGWGSPVGIAIFITGLGLFFAGFGLFFAFLSRSRLNQSKVDKAEYELKERQRYDRAPAREGGSQT